MSYMTELENGNFLMTPRVFAFKRNHFLAAVSHLLPGTLGGFQ